MAVGPAVSFPRVGGGCFFVEAFQSILDPRRLRADPRGVSQEVGDFGRGRAACLPSAPPFPEAELEWSRCQHERPGRRKRADILARRWVNRTFVVWSVFEIGAQQPKLGEHTILKALRRTSSVPASAQQSSVARSLLRDIRAWCRVPPDLQEDGARSAKNLSNLFDILIGQQGYGRFMDGVSPAGAIDVDPDRVALPVTPGGCNPVDYTALQFAEEIVNGPRTLPLASWPDISETVPSHHESE